ncbi:MAG: hypothetical protein UX39_C0026G0003 [Candidatus Magasanikbacteria bacterium GW2011_GWA2_46_17]|uniref:LamG-like jellyroll fold domain-containing protein n=1 Tax=Candidatus Magasanikbacteria bacterium GW2011_GWA2_46_17 TaxID=1619042 RepID=A0A0G1NYF0_9BACT|nr:MAG: hypothetical protein UX39_C0026G0003 [Candidatus Magasanikbacteria bacterium GW2011_GWA2_46_17]
MTSLRRIEGIVRFINIADRAQRAVANFPCGKFGWTNTQIIIELPVDAPFNATDVLEIQIERTDGRHSNFGKFTVNSDPLGPGICAISESCGESGTLFNVAGKRFGTAGGNIVFRNTSTAVETLAAKSPPDWSDESIQNVAVPAGLPDASYSIAARIAGPPISNSNSLPFNKPCPGLPCDLDTTMLGCQEDVDVCPALGPTYSCNTTTCRCVNNPLPKVIEQNSCTIGTQSPSPYRDQTDACLNAIIGARFNKDMDDATLIKTNMRFENCGSDSACSTPVNIDISPPVWLFDFIVWGGNGEEGIVLQSPAPLNADTYYRVILRANMAAGGYGLDGNGNGVPNGSPVDDYSWIFKTSSDSCEVNSISTSPVNMSVAVLSSKPINAIPQAENCNTLNAANYNWNWTQADATIATVTNIDSDSNTRVDPKQTVAGVKAGTTTVSANITTEPTIPAGTSNITVTNKLSCSDAGLTAVWKFDEQSGSVALDSGSSGANDGALVNNPTRLSSGCRFGKCLSFDGMADYVNVGNPASLSFDNKSFSAEAWVKINALTDDAVDEGIIADYGMGGGRWMLNKNRRPNGVFRFFLDPNGVWMDNDERIAVGSTIPATGKWYHVAGVYNHSTGDVKLYVNGSLENTASGAPISIGAVNNITIGDWFDLDGDRIGNGAAPINGLIDEVRVWNKALDISEIKSIYNQACMVLDKISCSDPNLAAVWKLDENSGIIANDSTANNNDGQLKFSPTWKSGADCKFITGSCLSFDGNNNYIDIPDDPIFNFGDGATDDPFTFEAWVKRSTTNSMDVIFSKYYTFNATDRSQYWFRINTDDTLDIYLVSAGDNRIGTKTNDPLLNDTNWHHVAATYDGNENANGLKIYVDGVAAPSTPNTTIGGPPGVYVAMSETAASFQIGRYTDSANNGENFSGSIDEPRIWNKALTQEEIVSAMNQSCLAGSAGKAVISCINDVAGLWNFDEGNGTLAADGSRNRNNGTLMSGPVWNMTGCQFGNCLNFDGANDYVKLPDIFLSTPKAMTVEGWFKTTTIAQSMLFSINSYSMYINRGGQPDGSLLPFFDNNSTGDPGWGDYNDGNWHYFAATTDGSTTSLYVNGEFINSRPENISQRLDGAAVGAIYDASANWYNGSIDELRVWNRVLSAAEIKSNYQKSMTACAEATLMCSDPQLTAVWKMDEGIGIIAGDSTKNNLDGALKNGLNNTGWKSGADCKFTNGKCLEFDGVDDIVEVDDNVSLDIASVFTLSAWVYVNGDTGDHQVIAGKWYDGESIAHSYYLELTPELHPEIGVNSAGCISPNAISANEWHFVAGTNDGATQKIYVDGVLKNSCNNGGSPNNTSAPLTIGRWTKSDDKNPFKGRIDEVMLWNKALTDNQIQSIYNSGNGQQCLAPQKGSACDLDLTAPMCQPNVGLCEGGDPDLRCSIKSCTCQDRFIVDPAPPNPSYTADSSGGTACRNTAISVNFNENIDASTIKTSTTTVKAINPPILSESFDALPAWTEVSSLYSPHWPVVNSGASTWSINTGFIIEASSGTRLDLSGVSKMIKIIINYCGRIQATLTQAELPAVAYFTRCRLASVCKKCQME